MTPKERAAKAIFDDQHKGLLNCLSWDDLDLDRTGNRNFYLNAGEAALSAIAEPSEAMIEDAGISMREAEAARYGEITMEDLFVVGWRAAHAAMMAEKDTGE